MHRAPLLRLLDDYGRRFPEEVEAVGRFRSFVGANEDCFERSLAVGHVTGSAWILDRSGTRALLTHHRKLDRWIQLGGHADGETDVLAVALREAREESGLAVEAAGEGIFDLDIHPIPEHGGVAGHLHYDLRFLLHATESWRFQVSDESHDLAWVPLERMAEYTRDESVLRLRDKTLAWRAERAAARSTRNP